MLDEPYRWIEAINDRRDYVEDQLRPGSPVVGLNYNEGMLLLTVGGGQRKIFEVHNRTALSAIGHPAYIEQLRMLATDTASVQGFQNSVDDVTLHRLANFVLGPAIKQAFEAIFGGAPIIKMLLAELGTLGRENQFISISYDGTVVTNRHAQLIGGTDAIENAMNQSLAASDSNDGSLNSTVRLALETWAVGRDLSLQENDETDRPETDESPADPAQIHEVLKTELNEGQIEAAVLDTTRRGNSKFRLLQPEEIENLTAGWL
ncbi:MAG: hypothetical protein OXN17_13735 [Candidatus Poribacteria bacterium]|nr:hypothetical protein [Candidatus Poribacteria bacterium]MDE0504504.1 hypothetical protein [Candidatus Poribacteria bacterium]